MNKKIHLNQLNKNKEVILRYIEGPASRIFLLQKQKKGKAVEYYLFDYNQYLTQETIWIPIKNNDHSEGELYNAKWKLKENKTRAILEKIGHL